MNCQTQLLNKYPPDCVWRQLPPAISIAGIFFLLLMAGCVGVERDPQKSGAPPVETVTVEPPMTNVADQSVTKVEQPSTKTPAKGSTPPVKTESNRKKGSTVSGNDAASTGKQGTVPPLDLEALKTQLRETKAIGVFTKIALKNQVDDLLNQFRAHYQGRAKTTLDELRQPYDMLLLKVLSLLQDSDPVLARTIVASRESIWSVLADPAKFSNI